MDLYVFADLPDGDEPNNPGLNIAMFPVPDIRSPDAEGEDAKSPDPVPAISGTQMDKRRSGPRSKPTRPVTGWLWQFGKLMKMTDAEMEEWSSEGDRVQWFRAKSEMKQWQEQGEQKIAELLRSNRSFKRMEATWTALASTNHLPGHQAYTRPELLEDNASLVGRVELDRARESKGVADACLMWQIHFRYPMSMVANPTIICSRAQTVHSEVRASGSTMRTAWMTVVQCDSTEQWQYNADSKGGTNPGRERLDSAEEAIAG
ncbi:hypothetical protein B0H10DRAFT_1967757 [Mycena sp. CBHHK59/15]|nr:hypothetical protein B0H10DRAFT_1967757 [Mycena sp. CBHHK59/15]